MAVFPKGMPPHDPFRLHHRKGRIKPRLPMCLHPAENIRVPLFRAALKSGRTRFCTKWVQTTPKPCPISGVKVSSESARNSLLAQRQSRAVRSVGAEVRRFELGGKGRLTRVKRVARRHFSDFKFQNHPLPLVSRTIRRHQRVPRVEAPPRHLRPGVRHVTRPVWPPVSRPREPFWARYRGQIRVKDRQALTPGKNTL